MKNKVKVTDLKVGDIVRLINSSVYKADSYMNRDLTITEIVGEKYFTDIPFVGRSEKFYLLKIDTVEYSIPGINEQKLRKLLNGT